MNRIRLGSLAVLAGVITLLLGVLAPASAGASTRAPYCGLVWGSLPESSAAATAGLTVTDVRAGRHACFDRLVLDIDSPLEGWSVEYVDEVVMDGSGHVVPVRGGAVLQVVARVGVIPTDSWFVAPGTLVDTSRYRTFRHVAWAGSFEGQTTIGLGVRARLPYRVFLLDGPGSGSRVVVDVAHRW